MNSIALLVIDEQIGAFDGKVVPAIHDGEVLISRSVELIESARLNDIPVVFIQHCATSGLLVEGTEAWAIHPSVAPQPTEPVVLKRASSAFEGTRLSDLLDEMSVTTVIACGLQSEHCVTNTSLGALGLGLSVYVARDAHSTWATDDEDAPTIIQRCNEGIADRGARIEKTKALLQMMRD